MGEGGREEREGGREEREGGREEREGERKGEGEGGVGGRNGEL